MKNKMFKYLCFILAGSAVVLTIAVTLGIIDVPSFLLIVHGSGITGAFAAGVGSTVTGPVTTEDTTGYQKPSIDKNLTLMQPDKYPFDTMLRNMSYTVKVDNWKTSYFAVDVRPLEDTVKTTLTATGTTSPPWATFNLIPNLLFMWVVDDVILVNGINGNDSKRLVLQVVAITATELTCIAINGIGNNNADVPALVSTTHLTRIGNAKDETASQTTPFTILPGESYNYCQVHMAQVEQSVYDKLTSKWVNWNLNDFRSAALWDMRGQMELTSLFGIRNKVFDPISKKFKYLSGGAIRFIEQTISKAAATFDNGTFIDIANDVFNGNNGSPERVVLAGSGALATMAKAPTFMKQIDARETEVVWGIRFKRVETNVGEFLFKHHPLLDHTGDTNNAFIMDMSNVEKHILKNIETRSIDFDKIGQRKTNADIIDEAFCVVFKNIDTFRIMKIT